MSVHSTQIWPAGRQVFHSGDVDGPELKIHTGYDDAAGRPATDAERRELKVEQVAERLRGREVWCVDSGLVTDAMRVAQNGSNDSEWDDEWSWDNVVNVRPDPSDWDITQCHDYLHDNGHDEPLTNWWAMGRQELLGLADVIEPDRDFGAMADDELRAFVVEDADYDNDTVGEWRESVRDQAEDNEVYEWWRVSKWMADKLKAAGECVLDNAYGEWWGRTCTGQSMMMDGTLQRVAAEMVN